MIIHQEALNILKDFKFNKLLVMNKEKICSGCLQEKPTVNRNMFDGQCADCTTKSLYDEEYMVMAQKNNERLKSQVN
jgi:hypothetical protein